MDVLTAIVRVSLNGSPVFEITHEIQRVVTNAYGFAEGRAYCGFPFEYTSIQTRDRVITCLWCVVRRPAA